MSWDGYFKSQVHGQLFSTVVDFILNCCCFIYIGAWLPFITFDYPELGITPWRLVLLLVAVTYLRRFPALLLLFRWVPEIATWKEALFLGHFGTVKYLLRPGCIR